MALGVLLPLLLPLVSWPVARWLAPRLAPRSATRLLTLLAVVFAVGSTCALALGTAEGLSLVPAVAKLGEFSPAAFSATAGVDVPLAIGCGVLLTGALLALARAVRGQWRWYRRVHAQLDEHSRESGVVVLPGAEPVAFAIAGRGGRVAVSSGMLAALSASERVALLHHERAHLRLWHAAYAGTVVLAAALNPFVRPLVTAARFAMERWADETAASSVGDRRVVATAVAKAALAGARPASYALAAGGGPVPQRVRALLDTPSPRRFTGLTTVAVALVLGVSGAAAGTGAQAALTLHSDIEAAQLATCALHPVVAKRTHGQATLTAFRQEHRECAQR